MPLLTRLKEVAAKVETTIGTPIALSAADGAFNAFDIDMQPVVTVEKREASGSFDWLQGVPGDRAGTLKFKTPIQWDGTATLPTWASTLLPACGWVDSSNTFTPRSEAPGSNVKTLTMGAYTNGVYKAIAGAMGTFKVMLPSGKQGWFEWEFRGAWQDVSDVALIAPTQPTAVPLRYASATTTYQTVAQCTQETTIDAGNNVILRECPNTAGGYVSALITNRESKITLTPEAQLVATEDRYGDWLSAVQDAFAVSLDGVNTSTIAFNAPKAQIDTLQEGDRDGLVIDDVTLMCNKNGATKDESLSIVFTPTV